MRSLLNILAELDELLVWTVFHLVLLLFDRKYKLMFWNYCHTEIVSVKS